ncbi:MAG: undecaprenyl-diphosphate phosphatase [Gemmatimonadota bacterium]
MPDLIKAVILGLVEGITEFIPVSSTGHLIIASDWLDFTGDRAATFEIFIQLGAILAIVWLYRARFIQVLTGWRRSGGTRGLVINLAIAFLPAAIVGFLFHHWIKEHLFQPFTVALALVAGGVVILLIERWHSIPRIDTVEAIPPSTALGIGLAQVLSLFPGVSRSGATIMGGYSLGLSRKAATEFSFFLAVPVMIAATLFDLVKSRDVLVASDAPLFAVGFVVAFLSALIVVKAFLGYVSHKNFVVFAWYRIVLGIVVIAYFWSPVK